MGTRSHPICSLSGLSVCRELRTTRRPGCDHGSCGATLVGAIERLEPPGMDLLLKDKVAVVTGAGRGIGLAITQALSEEGAHVVAGSLTIDRLAGLDRVTPVAVDLATPTGPANLVDRAIVDFGRVDVLMNNVGGVRVRLNGFLALTDEDFEWALLMNFFINLRSSRAALTVMLQQGAGTIVNLASVNAFYQPDSATVDYGAAKAAVVNLTKSLAQEFGPSGIRVNAISPGAVSTERSIDTHGTDRSATGRSTTPEQVATLAVLLASERTANVTGANYIIDGGLIRTSETAPTSDTARLDLGTPSRD
jgi:NAD(P)-dependent dehydrogenase (short-subunit alcohol dehydrogenase family)